MSAIYKVLYMLNGDVILGSQTFLIDKVLVSARSEQIPAEEASNVINYIDAHLAHNEVSPEVRVGLTRLYSKLLCRCGKT